MRPFHRSFLVAQSGGGGGGASAAVYVGDATSAASSTASRRAAVHASTAEGDRVFVMAWNRTTPNVSITGGTVLTGGAMELFSLWEVEATSDIVTNGVLVSGLSTNQNQLWTATVQGGAAEPTADYAAAPATAGGGWGSAGFQTVTYPAVSKTAGQLVFWFLLQIDGMGGRTWGGNGAEISFVTSDLGSDLAHAVYAAVDDSVFTDVAQTGFTSVASATLRGAYFVV